MKQNGVAKTLQVIGLVELACAFILCIAADFEGLSDLLGFNVGLVLIIGSFVTCMLFQGFAEVIELLHKSAKTQEAILNHLQQKPASKTVLEDIESNLPEI